MHTFIFYSQWTTLPCISSTPYLSGDPHLVFWSFVLLPLIDSPSGAFNAFLFYIYSYTFMYDTFLSFVLCVHIATDPSCVLYISLKLTCTEQWTTKTKPRQAKKIVSLWQPINFRDIWLERMMLLAAHYLEFQLVIYFKQKTTWNFVMLPSNVEAGNIRNNHAELLAMVVGVVFYRLLHFS